MTTKVLETKFNQHTALRRDLIKSISHKAGQNTSDRYVAVNTVEVVDKLHSKGFVMTELSGAYSKAIGSKDGKHRVVMINPDLKINKSKDDETFARVILMNSYDARSRLKVIAGLFRDACENGMVFGQIGDVSKISSKHVEGVLEAFDQIDTYLKKLPQMTKLIATYRDTSINEAMLGKLALEMAMCRQEVVWGSKFEKKDFRIDLDTMTDVWRKEDAKNDAWTIFNVLQEKVQRGGYDYKPFADSNMRQAKPIVNPYTQDKVNMLLFERFNQVLVS